MNLLFLWRLYLMVLRGATSLLGALERVGPENRDFFGRECHLVPKKSQFSRPTPSNAPRNDVTPLKTITYHAIKTTGTLIVNSTPTYSSKWMLTSATNVSVSLLRCDIL
jgi:hypothetical protein